MLRAERIVVGRGARLEPRRRSRHRDEERLADAVVEPGPVGRLGRGRAAGSSSGSRRCRRRRCRSCWSQLASCRCSQCAVGQLVVAVFSICGKRIRPKFASSVPTCASAARMRVLHVVDAAGLAVGRVRGAAERRAVVGLVVEHRARGIEEDQDVGPQRLRVRGAAAASATPARAPEATSAQRFLMSSARILVMEATVPCRQQRNPTEGRRTAGRRGRGSEASHCRPGARASSCRRREAGDVVGAAAHLERARCVGRSRRSSTHSFTLPLMS